MLWTDGYLDGVDPLLDLCFPKQVKKAIVICFSHEIMIVIGTNKSFSTRIALILLNSDLSFYENSEEN